MTRTPRGKHAAKAVDKEFRRMGATRTTVRDGVSYRFPDGARLLVPSNVDWAVAHSMMKNARIRNGVDRERDPILGERIPTTRLPPVDLTKISVTEHAKQRFVEMDAQDGMDASEVAMVLACPMRALWAEAHSTYAWIGERIAVVGHFRGDVLTVRTFLWATNDLWEAHPRPEKEKTP